MAEYKVVNATQLDADMASVADTIRTKGGTTEELAWPEGFKSAIEGIESGGGHEVEDAILNNTLTEYTNDRVTEIKAYALYSRTAVKSVSFPNATVAGIAAFAACTGLVNLDLPNVVTFSNSVLADCIGLKSTIGLPKLENTGEYSFQNCKGLTELNLPSLKKLGYRCFYNCSGLVKVKLYNRLTFFNGRGFEGCTSLKIADMGPNDGKIPNSTFLNCSALVAVVFRADSSVCTLDSTGAFIGTPFANGAGFIYVPVALVDSYKAATNWSTFAAQFRVLEDYTVDGTITGELDLEKMGVTL